MTLEEFQALQKRVNKNRGSRKAFPDTPKPNKFGAKKVEYDGIRFDSKAEGQYYLYLKLKQASGELKYFLRQVPFDLPGGIKARIDFMEVDKNGSIKFTDVKGVITPVFRIKKKQIKVLYGVDVIPVFLQNGNFVEGV